MRASIARLVVFAMVLGTFGMIPSTALAANVYLQVSRYGVQPSASDFYESVLTEIPQGVPHTLYESTYRPSELSSDAIFYGWVKRDTTELLSSSTAYTFTPSESTYLRAFWLDSWQALETIRLNGGTVSTPYPTDVRHKILPVQATSTNSGLGKFENSATAIAPSPAPTREGYAFLGWNITLKGSGGAVKKTYSGVPSGTRLSTLGSDIDLDVLQIEFSAAWQQEQDADVKIKMYDLNEGVNVGEEKTWPNAKVGSVISLTPGYVVSDWEDNYGFISWQDDEGNQLATYPEHSHRVTKTSETLTARVFKDWNLNVNFDLGGADQAAHAEFAPKTVNMRASMYDEPNSLGVSNYDLVIPSTIPTKAGYLFKNYNVYVTKEGSGTPQFALTTTPGSTHSFSIRSNVISYDVVAQWDDPTATTVSAKGFDARTSSDVGTPQNLAAAPGEEVTLRATDFYPNYADEATFFRWTNQAYEFLSYNPVYSFTVAPNTNYNIIALFGSNWDIDCRYELGGADQSSNPEFVNRTAAAKPNALTNEVPPSVTGKVQITIPDTTPTKLGYIFDSYNLEMKKSGSDDLVMLAGMLPGQMTTLIDIGTDVEYFILTALWNPSGAKIATINIKTVDIRTGETSPSTITRTVEADGSDFSITAEEVLPNYSDDYLFGYWRKDGDDTNIEGTTLSFNVGTDEATFDYTAYFFSNFPLDVAFDTQGANEASDPEFSAGFSGIATVTRLLTSTVAEARLNVEIPSTTPTKAGYSFRHWSLLYKENPSADPVVLADNLAPGDIHPLDIRSDQLGEFILLGNWLQDDPASQEPTITDPGQEATPTVDATSTVGATKVIAPRKTGDSGSTLLLASSFLAALALSVYLLRRRALS